MKNAGWIVAILAAIGVVVLALGYGGWYSVAADEPHWQPTQDLLAAIRDRSISVRSAQLEAPDLADPELIALGAQHYASMCSGCHLAPEMDDSELRQGLNPRPPDLSRPLDRSPAGTFWVIKHGIKMSGMPAWGVTREDESIWGIVAFVQQLPTLTASEYAALTARANGPAHEHDTHAHDAGLAGHGTALASGATIGPMGDKDHAHGHPEGAVHDH